MEVLKKDFYTFAQKGKARGMIKQVDLQDDFRPYALLLNESFATVASEFGLTRENASSNNAYITPEHLKSQLTDNRSFYYWEEKGQMVGFIVIEKSKSEKGTFHIEKLAVTPAFRHKGIGRLLMDFAIKHIQEKSGSRISIGLIDSNLILKAWYRSLGFFENEVKNYDHLPFQVCIMVKILETKNHWLIETITPNDFEKLVMLFKEFADFQKTPHLNLSSINIF